MFVLHPTVVKITAALGKRRNERTHTFPCAVAKPVGLLPILAKETLFKAQIARVLDRVFLLGDQIFITRHFHHRDFHLFHVEFSFIKLYYKGISQTRFCVPNFALYFVENLDKLLAYYNDDERKRAEKTLLRRVRFILL